MNKTMKSILYASSIFLVLVACLLTGHNQSPLRFLFFPLIILLADRTTLNILLKAGFTFSILFAAMVLFDHRPYREVSDLLAEALSFFLATMAAGYIARVLACERERSENAVATFHGLSEDLKFRTSNLQTTLDALSNVNLQLKKADQEKSRFLANVSHELRTPLTSIRSYSEILINYNDIDNETRTEFIRTINTESERMSQLVNETLDLLRIETGKLQMHIGPVHPVALLEQSLKVVAPMAHEKGIPVVLDIPADAPMVKGDGNQLNQVLINLLNNAIKFTARGKITAGVRSKEGLGEFFVADTGEGIFPEEREIIFEEYYRISEEVPNRPRGSGLGLSIARKIVEYHGGRMWVDSTPGKGSTFFFTIPVAEERVPGSPEAIPGRSEISRQYGPILVMYESIAIRQSLRKRLEILGYKTIGADNPRMGVELAVAIRPGLIITDMVGAGGDLAKLGAWAHGAGVEIMLATLYASPVNRDLHLAANGYLAKPFDRFQIASVVESLVKNGGHFFIVTPDKEEARHLQVLLGTEGYGATIYVDGNEAVSGREMMVPNGVIIGSFPRSRMEGLFDSLKGDARIRALPCFLLLEENSFRHITQVTLNAASRQGGEGISSLIMAIEISYAKTWAMASASGGS